MRRFASLGAALKLRAMSTPRYWRVRAAGQRHSRGLKLGVSSVTDRLRDGRTLSITATRVLLRAAAGLAVTLFLVAATQALPGMLVGLLSRSAWVPTPIVELLNWLATPIPSTLASSPVMTSSLAVAGTLAGVYFATVTFVVSSTYKDASARVRSLVTRIPVGRVYAVTYALAVAFTLVALALPVAGLAPSNLTFCLVGASAAFVVLSFGRIRTQFYGLLEPTAVLPTVARDLSRWTRQARRAASRRRPDTARIEHARTEMASSLITLRELIHLILDRERRAVGDGGLGSSQDPRILTSATAVIRIWERYAASKQLLRRTPSWSSSRPVFKDWFLASETEVSVAIATSTTLHPSETKDYAWVERQLADILDQILAVRDTTSLAYVLGHCPTLTRFLGARGMFLEQRLWLDSISVPAMRALHSAEAGTGIGADAEADVDQARVASRWTTSRDERATDSLRGAEHNLVDVIGLEHIQALLGLVDYCKRTQDIPSWARSATRDRREVAVGSATNQMLQGIQAAFDFERFVEGRIVTPDTAVNQLIAKAIATEVIDELDQLMNVFEDELWPWGLRVAQSNDVISGAALTRLSEGAHKLSTCVDAVESLLAACEAEHRDTDDRWPKTDLKPFRDRQAALAAMLSVPVARLAAIINPAHDPDRPDVFGWAYYRTQADLFNDAFASPQPDAGLVDARVQCLYDATWRAVDRIQRAVRRNHPSVVLSHATEPILQLLQLSGIAMVVSEVSAQPQIFEPYRKIWARDLSSLKMAKFIVERAALALDIEFRGIGITQGALHRSATEIAANQALEALGVDPDEPHYGNNTQEGLSDAPSRLARQYLRHLPYGHFEGLFYAAFLLPACRAAGASPPGDLARRLAHVVEEFEEHE